MRIDPNHKISLAGEYHPGINYCPECGEEVSTARYGKIGRASCRERV